MENIEKIKPSGIFTNYIYKTIPLAFDESLSYYETLLGVLSALKTQNEVINNNADVIKELEDYVYHYFDNLDVQEEINNKLDDMAQSGQLEEIISQFLELTSIFTFNSMDELNASEDLYNGSKAMVFGTDNYRDGGFKIFVIQDTTDLAPDNKHVFLLNSGKYAIVVNESVFKNDVTYNRFRLLNTNCFTVNISRYDKYNNKNIFKIGIANDYIGDDHFESTTHFAKRKNATVCTNAGIFNLDSPYQIWGACIIDGHIVVDNTPLTSEGFYYLTIDDEGHFGYVDEAVSPQTMLGNGVKNAVMGCFPLIVDGNVFSHGEHYLDGYHPRLVLCENYNGSQFIFACEGRMLNNVGLDFSDIQTYLLNTYPNIKFAMAMDGGGSLSVNVYKQKLNINLDDNHTTDRPVPYFLYIANENATNTEQDDINTVLDVMSEQTNNLNNRINTLNTLYTNKLSIVDSGVYPRIDFYTGDDLQHITGTIDVERGGISLKTTNGQNQDYKTTFVASQQGLTSVDGLLGSFLKDSKVLEDLNDTTLKSGIYYTDENTTNSVYAWQPVIYVRYANGEILEVLLPTSTYTNILYRRYNGETWSLYSTNAASTADRASVKPVGYMMFDTTLGIPIWYNGTNWVDSEGNTV